MSWAGATASRRMAAQASGFRSRIEIDLDQAAKHVRTVIVARSSPKEWSSPQLRRILVFSKLPLEAALPISDEPAAKRGAEPRPGATKFFDRRRVAIQGRVTGVSDRDVARFFFVGGATSGSLSSANSFSSASAGCPAAVSSVV